MSLPSSRTVILAMADPTIPDSAQASNQALMALVEAARYPLRDWPKHYPERRAIGYLCSYVPEEIIDAAGFSPVRIRGNAEPLREVDAHLQSFTCALCRSSLDQALGGELAFLSGVIFAHTCDAMQALADLWQMNLDPKHYVDVVMQPTNLGSHSVRPYLISELHRFRTRLASFVGETVRDEDVAASIARYNQTRQLVQSLIGLRDRLSPPHFFAVLDAAQSMPLDLFIPLLAEMLEELEVQPS